MSEWIDIGEQLRKAREGKDLELKDVSHSTRIPLATLSALEKNDYSIFPSPAYARSFLSQYSKYLDVDAHDWVEAFENGDVLSSVNEHSYLRPRHDHIGDFQHDPEPGRRRSKATDKYYNQSAVGMRKSHILQTLTVFLVTALLIGGGIYAYKKYEPMLTGSRSEQQESPDAAIDASQDAETVAIQTETKAMSNREPARSLPTPAAPATMSEPNSPLALRHDLTKVNRSGPPPKAIVIDEGEE